MLNFITILVEVLDAVLSCFIALLKIDSRDITSLSMKPDFVPTCRKLLDACQDGDQLGSLEILSNFELSQIGIKRPEKLMVINCQAHVAPKLTDFRSQLQRLRTSVSHGDFVLPDGCEVRFYV